MNQRKILASALLVAALIPLTLFFVSMLIVWKAYFEVGGLGHVSFFRICSSPPSTDCTQFTWLHLSMFSLCCLLIGVALAIFGTKKWKAANVLARPYLKR